MRLVATILSVLLLSMSAPALATDPEDPDWVPNLRHEQVWFTCNGSHRVQPGSGNGYVPGPIAWKTQAPAGPLGADHGCASVDNSFQGNNQISVQDSHFGGTFQANLDTLAVDVFAATAGPSQPGSPLTFNVRLTVDGTEIFGPDGREVTVAPAAAATGLQRLTFTVTGIGLLSRAENRLHDVLLTLSGGAVVHRLGTASSVRDTQYAWVYDATDAPSGLQFNPPEPLGVVVPR